MGKNIDGNRIIDGTLSAIQSVNTPAGNISATTVQAAINELDTEKQANPTWSTATFGVTTTLDLQNQPTPGVYFEANDDETTLDLINVKPGTDTKIKVEVQVKLVGISTLAITFPAGFYTEGEEIVSPISITGEVGSIQTFQLLKRDAFWEVFITGEGGGVDSVNGEIGVVVLDADDISDTSTTNKFTSTAEKATWNGKQDALVSGTNIKTINGSSIVGSGDLSISSYTDEQAQDSIGSILVDSTTIDFTYNDATPSITAIVKDGAVDNSKQATMPGLTVKGNAGVSTAAPQDIAAPTAERVFVRNNSSTLTFIQLTANYIAALAIGTGHIVNNAITYAKMVQLASMKVLGNLTGITSDISPVSVVDVGAALYGVVSSATNYTMDGTEHVVEISDTSAARTVTFAPATDYVAGKIFWIKDTSNAAGTNNITMAPDGSDTIDENTTIATNKGKRGYYSDGVSKFYNVI